MAYTTGTLTGTFVHYTDAGDPVPQQGVVTVTAVAPTSRDKDGNIVFVGSDPKTLDGSGSFSMTLPASNDPDLDPQDNTYIAVVVFSDGRKRRWEGIFVPSGGTVDLADVGSIDPLEPRYESLVGAAQIAAAEAKASELSAADSATVSGNAKDAAEDARDIAVQSAADAEAAKQDAEAVGSTNDTIIAGRINDPASATTTALSAAYATLDSQGRQPVRRDELVLNAKDFGFVGDGVTSNATARLDLIAALTAPGASRTVYWPQGVYLMDGPLNVSGVHHYGPGFPYNNPAAGSSGPDTATGAWLKFTGGASLLDAPSTTGASLGAITFEDMGLWAAPGSGHLIELGASSVASAGLTHTYFQRCYFELQANASVMHSTNVGSTYTRNIFDIEFNGCTFARPAASTVPPFDLSSGFGLNNFRILGGIWNNRGCATTPFFRAKASISGASVGPFIFRDIIGQCNAGGMIKIDNPKGVVVDSVVDWDLGARNFGTLSAALSTGGAITSLSVNALPNAFSSGDVIRLSSGGNTQTWTLTAAAAVGATSVTVASQVPNFNYPIGTNIQSAYQKPIVHLAGSGGNAPVGCWVDGVGTVDPGGSLFAPTACHVRIESGFNNGIGSRIYNGFSGTAPEPPLLIFGTGCDRPVTKYRQSAGLDFPSVAAGGTQTLTVTVLGVVTGDHVIAVPNSIPEAGLVFTAVVTAADTVSVRCNNVTTSAIDPVARTWNITALHY